MIYLFSGDDIKNKSKALDAFLSSAASGLEIISIEKSSFDRMHIESLYSGAGLFSSKNVVLFLSILEKEEDREFILLNLDKMAESPNLFVFSEGKLKKAVLDAFKKSRAELNVFEAEKEKKEKFNNFLLANAFGDKNKLELWIYFRQAMGKGVAMEALVGVLFWKAKDMILKRNFSKYSKMQLEKITSKLSYLLPEARRKRQDDEAVFEKFLLEAF